MIITRAPMRISFAGGGTDLPAFYTQTPGRVISTAINKYTYAAINHQPLSPQISVRYSLNENVEHPRELKNDRIREALLYLGITKSLDIATFSDTAVRTGMGSSSSFSVALMKALLLLQGKEVTQGEIAELASHLEIDLIKEPIGKQDQYAAAFGGMNIFQFNANHSVDVTPVLLGHERRMQFESHLQLFYTGIARDASSVLTEQKANTRAKMDILKKMADSVFEFRDCLATGDFRGLGALLHEGWSMKKMLASNVSNAAVDDLYDAGRNAGAWGGKILGAGGGGCLLFLSPVENKIAVKEAVVRAAQKNGFGDFIEVPVKFAPTGAEVLLRSGNAGHIQFS